MDDDIAELLLAEKRRALRWRDSVNYVHIVSFLILIAVAMIAIVGFNTSTSIMTIPLFGWPWPGIIWEYVRRRNRPRCPICGYNWEIVQNTSLGDSQNTNIEHWKNCPGCGVDLPEDDTEA